MSKKKLRFFEENKYFDQLFDRYNDEEFLTSIKGKWREKVFKNQNPLCLELACGKGEYAIALAERFPQRNYIGIDIKGDRINRGAKEAKAKTLKNVAFLRIQIDHLLRYFSENEIDEIWISFPDPHLRVGHIKKRLTSPRFIDLYQVLLKAGSSVHLKTDSQTLFDYSLETFLEKNLDLVTASKDVYKDHKDNELVTQIQTTYEKRYLEKSNKIKYLKVIF